MNRWTKVACVVAAVTAGGLGVEQVAAQSTTGTEQREGRRGGERGERGGERGQWRGGIAGMALQLQGITPEQKTKLEAIQKEQQEQMRARRDQGVTSGTATGDRGAMRDQMMKAMQEQRTKVEAILTEAQKKELGEKLSSLRGGGQGRRGGEKRGNE